MYLTGHKSLLVFIVALAFVLRIYKLADYPVSLSWDEVAIGYNAFSIAQTGADEYGHRWPLLFQSFNDYKLPGYIYLDALFIKFLGLSEFSTRLPSALFGTLAVIIIYFLVKELSKNFNSQLSVAHLAALMLAISPWHLQLSRAAFEANLAQTFVLAGITLLFYGLKNKLAAFISVPTLGASLYFYYSPRIFMPLILLIFILIFKKKITANFKQYLWGMILAIILIIPITTQILSPQGLKRVEEVSIFADKSKIVDYVDPRAQSPSPFSAIFLNRRIPIVFESLHNYFAHLSFGFLFFGDDPNPRHRSSFHGNFYLFEIPLILAGLWFIAKTQDKKLKYFLLAWILVAPIPAAFAQEAPHGLRAANLLPPLIIASAAGLHSLLSGRLKLAMIMIALILFANYLFSYYQVYPRQNSTAWAYGYRQMIRQIQEIEGQYDRIIITGHYWKPYIFYLFYDKFDPRLYQLTSSQATIGQFRFGTTSWDSGEDLNDKSIQSLKGSKTLLVISLSEFESLRQKDKFKLITTINDYSQKSKLFLIGEWL